MWMFTEWGVRNKPSTFGMINRALAGLICITPAAGYVDMTGGGEGGGILTFMTFYRESVYCFIFTIYRESVLCHH